MDMSKPNFSLLLKNRRRSTQSVFNHESTDPRSHLRATEIYHKFKDEEHDNFRNLSYERATSIPFNPVWTFGIDILTKIINLTTTKNEWNICYTVCQLGVVYNHNTKRMNFLMGHQNLITCIAIDESGEWLVSADDGKDNKIIVWDLTSYFPVCTIFEPHPDGVMQIGMSQDAKYLASVGNEPEPVLKFWLWTLGNDTPDAIYIGKKSYGPVMNIEFNPNNTMMFVVTFSYAILFCTWQENDIKVKEAHIPRSRIRNFGEYSQSIYGLRMYNCYTATSQGWVLIWGQKFHKVPYKSLPITNNKVFLRAIRLDACGIKNICYVDGFIQTLNYNGKICFYDKDLKILYYAIRVQLPPSVAICFNLKPRNFTILDYKKEDTTIIEEESQQNINRKETKSCIGNIDEEYIQNKENVKIIDVNSSLKTIPLRRKLSEIKLDNIGGNEYNENKTLTALENYMTNYHKENFSEEGTEEIISEKEEEKTDSCEDCEVYIAKQLPSDFTLQKAPFIVRDFIILTMDGKCAYVDTGLGTIDYFMDTNYRSITAIDLNSKKYILVVAYEDGWIYSYDYRNGELRNKVHIPSMIKKFEGTISCIRYSHEVIGSTKGTIAFLNPITAEPEKLPLYNYNTNEILDVIFSEDDEYIAYRDSSRSVTVIKRVPQTDAVSWICHGKVIAHRDTITGMLFCKVNRLFTIGKDRLLVEYYVKYSKPGTLEVISQTCIMQTGFPVSIMAYNVVFEEHNLFFLITTSEHKYIIVSERNTILEKTILTPSFDYVIHQVELVPNVENKFIVYSYGQYLGLQLLPLSGNPYRSMAIIANSSDFITFRISGCGQYVFTYGLQDNVCVMWTIKFESVEGLAATGGKHLNPYYCLIEGGREGRFFKEVMDAFYFIQILHQGDDSQFRRECADSIPVVELPNMMRAIGFFPSEHELDNIVYEATTYFLYSHDKLKREENIEDEVSFDNFIKLYLNHRPVHSVTKKEIENAFKVLERQDKLSRSAFVKILCTLGEPFTPLVLHHCFATLLSLKHTVKGQRKYLFQDILPNHITCDYFLYELLGIEEDNVTE